MPPAVIESVSEDHEKDEELTSSLKRTRNSNSAALQSLIIDQQQRQKALLEQLKRENDERKNLRTVRELTFTYAVVMLIIV